MLAKLTNFQMIQWVEGNHLTKSTGWIWSYFTCLDFPERRENPLGPLGLEFHPLSAKVVEIPWPTCIYPMSKEETFDSHDPKQLHMSCV